MNIESFLQDAVERKASDVYIMEGKPVTLKINGSLYEWNDEALRPEQTEQIVRNLYELAANRDFSLLQDGDDDFAVVLRDVSRFRVNVYRQSLSYASVIRTIPVGIPDPEKINIPDTIIKLADFTRGIILFTGTTGSGKTTSLACLIDRINSTRQNHIVTIEDPIEYRHEKKQSLISQRELSSDTESFMSALRAAMRQAPDVILVGEMRDQETIGAAITAAETGHLVISTLHTMGAASTIDRIIDSFPGNQQNQIRAQLSMTLQAVVSQQLIPTLDKKLRPAFEIMVVNSAIRNLIRENKVFQIENIIQTSVSSGMQTMDMSLFELFKKKIISRENALIYSVNQQQMHSRLGGPKSF